VNDFQETNRFHPIELIEDPNTQVKHFEPILNARDRFSNRIFSSPNFAYRDREGEKVKAALLVSLEGEEFIRANKDVLNDIDKGLSFMQRLSLADKNGKQRRIDLGTGRSLSYLTSGGQSDVYLLETQTGRYVVKILKPNRARDTDASQPYINEMLQVQSIKTDLKGQLDRLGVEMPTFLFASGVVSCTEFVDGVIPERFEVSPVSGSLKDIVRRYADEKRKTNSLWKKIAADITTPAGNNKDILKTDNFIKRKKDGKLVWVDPLYYSSSMVDEMSQVFV